MGKIWVDLPGINRSIGVEVNYVASEAMSLGCHCGTITGVTVSMQSVYSGSKNSVNNIKVTTATDKDRFVETTRIETGAYRGYYVPTKHEIDTINQCIKEGGLDIENLEKVSVEELAISCQRAPIWVLSDVINYRAPARNGARPSARIDFQIPIISSGVQSVLCLHTSEFVEYLIRSKNGYVFESPIVQNPGHRSWGNYSLNRVWVWIPETQLKRAALPSNEYGRDKFPSYTDWKKIVFDDLKTSSKAMYPSYIPLALDPSITEGTVEEVVFNGGVFPVRSAYKEGE